MVNTILLTGGLGYIGSHCAVQLLKLKYKVIIIDNTTNTNVLKFIYNETGIKPKFYNINMCNYHNLNNVFNENKIDAVIHLANYKSVSASIREPILYYENNLIATINLINIMTIYKVKKLIFSSSATVYGLNSTEQKAFSENDETGKNLTNPYGKTKYIQEMMLKDLFNADNTWTIIILRYFNPIGALLNLGENLQGENLMPILLSTLLKPNKEILIYGSDYETIDGTCERDFIHIMDLVDGHIKCLQTININGLYIYNLGTGKPTSVLSFIKTFNNVNKTDIKIKFTDRRPGDIATSYADVSKINTELNWHAKYTISDMCRDSYQAFKNLQ